MKKDIFKEILDVENTSIDSRPCNSSNKKDYLRVDDFNLSIALSALGYSLHDTLLWDKGISFVFDKTNEIEHVVLRFYYGNLHISPKGIFKASELLKWEIRIKSLLKNSMRGRCNK